MDRWRRSALRALQLGLRLAIALLPRPKAAKPASAALRRPAGEPTPVIEIPVEAFVQIPVETIEAMSEIAPQQPLSIAAEIPREPQTEVPAPVPGKRASSVNSYASRLQTVVDDATIHVQADGTVRLFASPVGVRIIFEGPDVDAHTIQSVCTYILGTKSEDGVDLDAIAASDDPGKALNIWYFSQPWEEQRKDRALRHDENLSVPITFLSGSQERLVLETELLLLGLNPLISESVRVVRYFGVQGDPPAVTGGGMNTDSLVRHLCHLIRLRNDFKAETRTLPPDTFLLSKLKISFPEIAVLCPELEGVHPNVRDRARALTLELLDQARIVSDPSLLAD